ncbi:MAG: M1 family metallopeptidase [Planctomycetes bacterium]|nr:M1 family metallopeptidase [Planctomycetota bacterium]
MYKNGHILQVVVSVVLWAMPLWGAEEIYSRADILRGSVTPERAWWDVTYYHLDVKVDPSARTISGTNTVEYRVLKPDAVMQIDLQPPMNITRVTQDNTALAFRRDGNVFYITLQKTQKIGHLNRIVVDFGGVPRVSKRPPWDGGVAWKKDENGTDFIATANQGAGASLWWPCKDHPADEPEHMLMSVNVPEHLTDVSNGRLAGIDENVDGTRTFHWRVSNPINHYGVNINVGDYVHFSEVYDGEKGPLDCDYWVLSDNLEKAKREFKDVPRMLKAFEYWFGPYPFYEDSYKLVEVPYPGMEHQSSVTYGNGYANGFGGRDESDTGWGLKFDFIIIHESGHEWFANNISNADVAYMWIHEAFIAYSENLFVEYHYGEDAATEYVLGKRRRIGNHRPIEGTPGVNRSGSGDMYTKGANMLHTLRQWVGNDQTWRSILRGLNVTFYHQTVTGAQVETYMADKSGLDLNAFFDQYVRDTRIPVLEYFIKDDGLHYRWAQTVKGFAMPIQASLNNDTISLSPTTSWKTLKLEKPVEQFSLDPNYYVTSFNLTGK